MRVKLSSFLCSNLGVFFAFIYVTVVCALKARFSSINK